MYPWGWSWRTTVVKNTVYQFVDSNLVGLDIFENERTSAKGWAEIEDWDFSVHFGLGFQENSMYT